MESYFDMILQNPGLNHLTTMIFGNLDTNSLFNCLEVSDQWYQFIKENRRLWKQHDFPLHRACISGHFNAVKLLIELGFDVNARNGEKEPPLLLACIHKRLKVTKLLCQHPNIDVNATNRYGCPLIIIALYENSTEIFHILLNHPKINVNATVNLLHVACKYGNVQAVEMLCLHPNINVNAQTFYGFS